MSTQFTHDDAIAILIAIDCKIESLQKDYDCKKDIPAKQAIKNCLEEYKILLNKVKNGTYHRVAR